MHNKFAAVIQSVELWSPEDTSRCHADMSCCRRIWIAEDIVGVGGFLECFVACWGWEDGDENTHCESEVLYVFALAVESVVEIWMEVLEDLFYEELHHEIGGEIEEHGWEG